MSVSSVHTFQDGTIGDITTLLSLILERLPMPDRMLAMRVVGTDGTALLTASPYSVIYNNANSNPNTGQGFWRLPEQWYFSNMGSNFIYDQIKVT